MNTEITSVLNTTPYHDYTILDFDQRRNDNEFGIKYCHESIHDYTETLLATITTEDLDRRDNFLDKGYGGTKLEAIQLSEKRMVIMGRLINDFDFQDETYSGFDINFVKSALKGDAYALQELLFSACDYINDQKRYRTIILCHDAHI